LFSYSKTLVMKRVQIYDNVTSCNDLQSDLDNAKLSHTELNMIACFIKWDKVWIVNILTENI